MTLYEVSADKAPLRRDPGDGKSGVGVKRYQEVVDLTGATYKIGKIEVWMQINDPNADWIQAVDGKGNELVRKLELQPAPPPPPSPPPTPPPPPPPPTTSTDTLYVWGGNPINIYADSSGQKIIGTLPSDPTFQHPILVGAANDNAIVRWRRIVSCADPKLIGGWAIERQYAFTVLARKSND